MCPMALNMMYTSSVIGVVTLVIVLVRLPIEIGLTRKALRVRARLIHDVEAVARTAWDARPALLEARRDRVSVR